jgi:succinoglycan biosynthesis transport protein ExoP
MTKAPLIDALPAPVQGETEWTVGTLMTVLRRRRLLLRPVIAMLLLAACYCTLATRRYKATGDIQIQKEATGEFGLESGVMGRDDNSVSTDSLDYNITLQTAANILQSNALALVVIRDLKLEDTHDYFPQHAGTSPADRLSGAVSRLSFWRKPLEPLSIPLDQAPNRRYKALKIFASHLKVEPVIGTRLIDVSYSDPDPARSAAVVNHLIAELQEFTFQQRFTATLQGSSWLTGQLADLKRQMQELQAKAIALQRDTGMFGNDASRNTVLARLDSLNQTLAQAESNRILKEAIDRVAANGDPELISSLGGNSNIGAVSSMANSLTLVQSLRTQEAGLRAELAEDTVRYGPAYPKLGELQAQLAGVDRSIQEEVHRLGERAHSDYLVAAREEAGARAAFEQQKVAAGKLNDSMLAYGLAKQEADSSRDIYENLLSKLKQTGVLQGLKASNITVVAMAQVPPPDYPSSPRILLILAAAVAAGLLLGGALTVGIELTDNKVRSFEGMERTLNIPLIAVLPMIERAGRRKPGALSGAINGAMRLLGRPASPTTIASVLPGAPELPPRLAALDQQPSTFAEGLRSLRTALLLSRSGRPPQVVLITSCLEGEGKTTLALNLAALLAQGGSRVLLVDADLRKPTLCTWFGSSQVVHGRGADSEFSSDQIPGLGVALTNAAAPGVRNPLEAMPNFAVLCGEEVPPFPSELLSSARMRSLLDGWKTEYDFIVLDSPPVLPVTDAVLLSQVSDATLLVARHGQTTRQALKRSAEALRKQHPGHAALGMVLNAVSRDSGDFYEYFGYQGGLYADAGSRA